MNNVLYDSGYISDGFIVLDEDPNDFNESSFSYVASSSSKIEDKAKMWHARLSHIGQEHVN